MTMATGKPRTPLRSIRAKNYRSFVDVDVEFGPFSVLAGPNGSGKSNLLSVLQLVRDTARTDIPTAVDRHGGYEQLRRATGDAGPIELADASFGAVRMLALLTALHDPDPRLSPSSRRSTTACTPKPWTFLRTGCGRRPGGPGSSRRRTRRPSSTGSSPGSSSCATGIPGPASL